MILIVLRRRGLFGWHTRSVAFPSLQSNTQHCVVQTLVIKLGDLMNKLTWVDNHDSSSQSQAPQYNATHPQDPTAPETHSYK